MYGANLTMAPMVPLLTTSHVARLFAVSPRSILLWAELGESRGIKVGRQWRFRSEVVQKWLTQCEPAAELYSPLCQMVTRKLGNNGINGKRIPQV
jgi:excisionase family DNA binding protein